MAKKAWDTDELLLGAKQGLGEAYVKESVEYTYSLKEALKKCARDCKTKMTTQSRLHNHCELYISQDIIQWTGRVSLWRVYKIAKMMGFKMCFVNKEGHIFSFSVAPYQRGRGAYRNKNARPGDAEIFQ